MSKAIEIRPLKIDEIEIVRRLSDEIWKKVYPSIISMEQIEYMLELIYNEEALKKQINVQGHQFILVIDNNTPIGYASYSLKVGTDDSEYRLHKFYLQPEQHGKGLGKQMMNHIIHEVQQAGGNSIELNVNKYNPTLHFYKKLGFSVISEEILDIGNGYVMDDYIMRLNPLKYPL
ncbi:MAG: GNAT family N-acetyltransferase [Chitinophagia bacterium]|nr:GNAT family N-acetyltransferase [Chitinophagia bacterium]